ncbi:MAG: glutamate--tRNA ligase, partial [Vulcanococcus sp.]
LGAPAPVFAHTPLILNKEGKKLSKRDGVTSVSDFRAQGYTAKALANYMTLLGWSPPEGMGERFTLEQAAAAFDFDRVNKAGARFDWDKLNWLNSQVLHERSPEQLLAELQPLWAAQGWDLATAPCDTGTPSQTATTASAAGSNGATTTAWALELCALIGPSLTTLQDGIEQARPFFERPELSESAQQQLASEGARPALAALLERLPDGALTAEAAQTLLGEAVAAAGVKKGVLMKSLRAALLGSLQGPDLLTTWLLLQPSGEAKARIARSL